MSTWGRYGWMRQHLKEVLRPAIVFYVWSTLIFVASFIPASGWVLQQLVARMGQSAVSDHDLLNFVLSLPGALFVLLTVGLVLTYWFAEQAAILVIMVHAVRGTLSYLAPETIAEGCSSDERSDIYSLGISLFEMLTGRRDRRLLAPVMMHHIGAFVRPNRHTVQGQIGQDLQGAAKLVAKRATAIFLNTTPSTGSFNINPSILRRPCSVL